MKEYELIFLVDGSLPKEEAEKISEKVFKLISGAQDVKKSFLGKRDTAYRIKHQLTAYYAESSFKSDPELVKDLADKIKTIPEVVRYLVLKKDKK